jgi:hypothetical protein
MMRATPAPADGFFPMERRQQADALMEDRSVRSFSARISALQARRFGAARMMA